MRYLSLFSGIEAATSAWHQLGWECVGVSEIEGFPCTLLAYRYPNVPNLGDVTKITEEQIAALGRIDAIIFGSPCQDLSVAGKRKGFTDESGDTTRSGLFFTAMQIIGWARKHNGLRFALWENVPGAFSSSKGRDFAAVVDQLAGLEGTESPAKGWGTEGCAIGSEAMVEWAVLDAQWFGVAQRRRRVFALADFGDWASRPPILLEPESLRGDSPPSREAGQAIAGALASRIDRGGFPGGDESCSGYVQPVGVRSTVKWPAEVATTLDAHFGDKWGLEDQHINGGAALFVPAICGALTAKGPTAMGSPEVDGNHYVAYGIPGNWIGRKPENGGNAVEPMHDVSPCLTKTDMHGVSSGMQVRRLTPRECERLQGFPDDHTLIPVKGKPAADGPRYKALGNSMAVPVIVWIGKQIETARLFS